jgi:hypothetical protein
VECLSTIKPSRSEKPTTGTEPASRQAAKQINRRIFEKKNKIHCIGPAVCYLAAPVVGRRLVRNEGAFDSVPMKTRLVKLALRHIGRATTAGGAGAAVPAQSNH